MIRLLLFKNQLRLLCTLFDVNSVHLQDINLHYFRTTHISDTRRKFSRKLCYLKYNFLLEVLILMVMFNSKLGKNYISVIGKGPFSELGRVRSWNWERPVPIGNGSVYRTQLKKEKKRCYSRLVSTVQEIQRHIYSTICENSIVRSKFDTCQKNSPIFYRFKLKDVNVWKTIKLSLIQYNFFNSTPIKTLCTCNNFKIH